LVEKKGGGDGKGFQGRKGGGHLRVRLRRRNGENLPNTQNLMVYGNATGNLYKKGGGFFGKTRGERKKVSRGEGRYYLNLGMVTQFKSVGERGLYRGEQGLTVRLKTKR